MRRGEIRWYTFKAPDKKRPVLILTRDSILDVLGEVTIAPITSTIRHIPSEVILTSDDGLPKTCAINLDQVQTVTQTKVGPFIAALRGKTGSGLAFCQTPDCSGARFTGKGIWINSALRDMAARNADAKQAMETFAEQHDGRLDDYFYLPLRGRNKDIVMALSAKDGKPVGWIAISPWLSDDQNEDGNQ
jgi:mRNA interferase MazF